MDPYKEAAMSDQTDAGRFYAEAAEFFFSLAPRRNLGIAQGRWDHPRFGDMRVIAVYGWVGTLYVTLVCCGTEAALANGQVRLWWWFADQTEHFEFKHVAVRRPMSETTVRGRWSLMKTVLGNLNWLRSRSIDQVLGDLLERNVAPVTKSAEAMADPDNELPSDPEEP
jgi:hypothetical protein